MTDDVNSTGLNKNLFLNIQALISGVSGCCCRFVDFKGEQCLEHCSLPDFDLAMKLMGLLPLLNELYAEVGLLAALSGKPVYFLVVRGHIMAAVPVGHDDEGYAGAVVLGFCKAEAYPNEAILELPSQKKLNHAFEKSFLDKPNSLKTVQSFLEPLPFLKLKSAAELMAIQVCLLQKEQSLLKIQKELDYVKLKLLAEKKHNTQQQLDRNKNQLEMMHLQYSPVFVNNALNTISRLALIENAPKTQEATIAWFELNRYASVKIGEMTTLLEELENLNRYLKIQNIRFQNKFRLELNVPKSAENLSLPGTVVLHMAEFMVLNGLYKKPENGSLMISVSLLQDCALVELKDDGIGFSELELYHIQNEKHLEKEYDLSLFYQVNQILSLTYGNYYKAELYSKKGEGALVRFKIPFLTREG